MLAIKRILCKSMDCLIQNTLDFDPIKMVENNEILEIGKVFNYTLDLREMIDIRVIKIEVK